MEHNQSHGPFNLNGMQNANFFGRTDRAWPPGGTPSPLNILPPKGRVPPASSLCRIQTMRALPLAERDKNKIWE